MKTVIIGAHGHLGSALVRKWTSAAMDVTPLDLPDFDVTARRIVLDTVTSIQPGVIVNASGIEHIDWLETHPNTSRYVHVQGTANLREAAKRTNAVLLQFSTAEVFGASDPTSPETGFIETNIPEPQSVYAKTKLDAERAASEWGRHLIIRTSMLFGQTTERSRGGLIETLLNAVRRTRSFQVVSDQYVSPTWTDHLADASLALLQSVTKNENYGLFHVANHGVASYYEVALELARITGLKLAIEPITYEQYQFKVPRALSTALDGSRFAGECPAFVMTSWKTALEAFIESRSVKLD